MYCLSENFYCLSGNFIVYQNFFFIVYQYNFYCLSVEMLLFIRKHFLARLCILSSCNSCLTRDYLQLFCFLVEPQQSELHPHHHGHIHPEVRGAAGCIHSHLTDQLPQVYQTLQLRQVYGPLQLPQIYLPLQLPQVY